MFQKLPHQRRIEWTAILSGYINALKEDTTVLNITYFYSDVMPFNLIYDLHHYQALILSCIKLSFKTHQFHRVVTIHASLSTYIFFKCRELFN